MTVIVAAPVPSTTIVKVAPDPDPSVDTPVLAILYVPAVLAPTAAPIVSTVKTSPVVSSIFTVEDSIGRESLRIQFAPNLTALEPSRPKEDLTSLN